MSSNAAEWHRVQLITEPTRRRVYDAVRVAREPMTRDQVAAVTSVSRRLAAFHLDLLADGGLLDVDFARPEGRSGPGAGRPAKRYRARPLDIDISVPPRRYDIAARVLARTVAQLDTQTADGSPADHAAAVAREEGRLIGAARRSGSRMSARKSLDAAADVLRELGYEPESQSASCVQLRNCPFHAVVDVAPALVCGLNDALIGGILDGMGASDSVSAALDGVAPNCCVTVAKR